MSVEDVDLVIRRASRHFSDLLDEESNPLVVALALQDTSSVGLQHYAGEFTQLHADLKSCLKAQVDSNYQGFNSAVGAYRSVVHGFNDTHAQVRHAHDQLISLRSRLETRKPMLRDLQESSLRHKQMLELLDVVEGLNAVPDKFEECISQKRFLQALHVLSSARSTINAHNLLQVPEIAKLYSYVVSQQASLVSTLVEELKAHIYLKSPFTSDRWEPFTVTESESGFWTGEELENALRSRLNFQDGVGKQSSLENFLHEQDTATTLPDDQPAEQNTFEYIKSLLVTLRDLNSLGTGLEQLVQTLKPDFQQLVEETVADAVKQAHITVESLRRSVPTHLFDQRHDSLRILEALAVTLFTKLAASLEAHRVVADVAIKIGNIDYPLNEVCTALRDELASFLLTYIDESGVPVLRARGRSFSSMDSGTTRSRWVGPLFEFGDEPPASTADLDVLLKSLKKSVPGLTPDLSTLGSPFADTVREAHLSVVVPAHILNVRALLEPTAGFLQRTRTILKGFDTCVSYMDRFLDDWLRRTFMPRLELALQHAFDDILADPAGLQVQSEWSKRSQLPITIASVKFVDLVYLLCQLLNTGAHFRAEYANLLLDLLETVQQYFEDKMVEQDVSGGKNQVSQSILRDSEPLLRALYANNTSDFHSEIKVYLARRNSAKAHLKISDLLDTEVFRTMALLATSSEWIAARLRKMRVVRAAENSSENAQALRTRVRKRWTLLEVSSQHGAGAVLDNDELTRFDTITTGLDDLAWRILSLLRVDTMLRVVYYLDQMFERGNFASRRREEPNLVVDALQRELAGTSDICRERMSEHDRDYVFYGIPQLMQELFILKSEVIPELTEAGHDRVCSSIFSLQQLLTSLVADPKSVNFSRAASYYDLFRLSPNLILEKARNRETDLTFEDLSLLLRLKHRHDSRAPALSEQLAQLKEYFGSGNTEDSKATARASTSYLRPKKSVDFSSKSEHPEQHATKPLSAISSEQLEKSSTNSSKANISVEQSVPVERELLQKKRSGSAAATGGHPQAEARSTPQSIPRVSGTDNTKTTEIASDVASPGSRGIGARSAPKSIPNMKSTESMKTRSNIRDVRSREVESRSTPRDIPSVKSSESIRTRANLRDSRSREFQPSHPPSTERPAPAMDSSKVSKSSSVPTTQTQPRQQSLGGANGVRSSSNSSSQGTPPTTVSQASPSQRALEAARRVRERSSSQRLRQ